MGLGLRAYSPNPKPCMGGGLSFSRQTKAIAKQDCSAAAGLLIRGVALPGLGLCRLEQPSVLHRLFIYNLLLGHLWNFFTPALQAHEKPYTLKPLNP